MTKSNKPIMLAAGGTGGHLFPAESLAQELINRGYKVVILTDKRGHAFKSLGDNVEVKTIYSATFKAGVAAKLKALLMLKLGAIQSFFLLMKYKPACVVGFGGYPSFPPLFMSQLLFFKTIIHEQNAVLGKANIYLAPMATKVAASLPNTKGIKPKDLSKVEVIGNPVREKIRALRDKKYPALEDEFRILITGGSQGAKVFSNIVPPAIIEFAKKYDKKIYVTQQCIADDVDRVRDEYNKAGIDAEVDSFIYDMDKKLEQSHIFIGRSGASTVAEIAVAGRPAIFVPYPNHADMQQLHNAKIIADIGGAVIFEEKDFTVNILQQKLEELANNPNILENMASDAKSCGQPEAVINLASLVEGIVNK